MPSKRAILENLKRHDLIFLIDHFELDVASRRSKDPLIQVLAKSRRVSLDTALELLSLSALKQLCGSLELESNGRSKRTLIDRINPKPIAKKTPAVKKAAPKATKTTPTQKKAIAKKEPVLKKAPAVKKAAPKAAKTTPTQKKAIAKKEPVLKKASTTLPRIVKKQVLAQSQTTEAKTNKTNPQTDAPPQHGQNVLAETRAAAPDYSRVPQPAALTLLKTQQCPHCQAKLSIATCSIHQCQNDFINNSRRKICSECWFDRSSGSLDNFFAEEKIDHHCPECGQPWQQENRQTSQAS